MPPALIVVEGLKKHYVRGMIRKTVVRAVDGVSFDIKSGETFSLVGESGCGKSTIGRCILNLTRPTGGRVCFRGMDISSMEDVPRDLRRKIQVIFQDADGTLNPRMKVFDLMMEPFRVHGIDASQAAENASELMDMVNLTPDLLCRYPHELSGGQRQRIGIARAMALGPEFIVADEPAASLDLSVQAQMLHLMKRLQADHGIGYLYISHNLRIVRLMADRVAVMYLGKLVEVGPTGDVFRGEGHPYTRALLSAVPALGRGSVKRLILDGDVPSPIRPPSGCRFHTRCPYSEKRCAVEEPSLAGGRHLVACHLQP